MAKVVRSLTTDPRYEDFLREYASDYITCMEYLFGMYPSDQQEDILSIMQQDSVYLSIKSGHGTGKSLIAAALIIIFMILHPNCRVVVIAPKISIVKDAIWVYMDNLMEAMSKRVPWIHQYFELTATTYYEKANKLSWNVGVKGYKINNEQSLAGEHRDDMLTIVDEGSIMTRAAYETILGAQTSRNNRVMIMSQPTHSGGFFYDTFHTKSIHHVNENGKTGNWHNLTLASDESEWVTEKFILDALINYGGYDSPEYQVKVLGEFPAKMREFLLGREEAQSAVGVKVDLDDDWGFVATCDVGLSRDSSVINISKVSGAIGATRKVQNLRTLQMPPDVTPLNFARKIVSMCCTGSYPNITIAIDGDGVGNGTWERTGELLEEEGHDDVTLVRIGWGKPPFSMSQKRNFKNLRAMAYIYAGDAIKSGRMSLDKDPATVEQFSKLPLSLNADGQYVMMPKPLMKTKHQISSPDRADTYAFTQIINYVPASENNEAQMSSFEAEQFDDWLQADLPGLDIDSEQENENWEDHILGRELVESSEEDELEIKELSGLGGSNASQAVDLSDDIDINFDD